MRLPYNGQFKVSQLFGENPAMYKPFGLQGHNGIDFAIPNGTPILAPHQGTVREASFDKNGYGWYVKIENSQEGSVLGHFKEVLVKVGQVVNEGYQVGVSDNTGFSTGPHLHWGYYWFPRDRKNGYRGFQNQYEAIKQLLASSGQNAEETVLINKKDYEMLKSLVDTQKKRITNLETNLGDVVAVKDRECQDKMRNQRAEITGKFANLAAELSKS